jgi:hypothetical protein
MGVLILGIIMDVLVHITIKDFQGLGVDWIPSSSRDFAVLDPSELVVLAPEIGLEDFGRRREPEQGRVSRRDTAACSCRSGVNKKSRADCSRTDSE